MKRLLLTVAVSLMACFAAPAQNIVNEFINDILNDVVSDALDEAFDEALEKAREKRQERRAEREASRAEEAYEDSLAVAGDEGFDVSGEEEFYDVPEDEFDEEYWDEELPEFRHGLGVYGGHYYMTGYSKRTGTDRETDYNDKFHIGLKYTFYEDQYVSFLVKYEQTSFWESFQAYSPISETIFSPALELSVRPTPAVKFVTALEARTNGKGYEDSRKFNYVRLAMYRYFPLRDESFFAAAVQTYFGVGYIQDDRSMANLYNYNGYFTAGAWYQTPDANFKVRVTATPYDHFRHCGVQVNLHYRPDYSLLDNVYYMIQYGYGLEQQQQYLPFGRDLLPQHYIRFGICICPEFVL